MNAETFATPSNEWEITYFLPNNGVTIRRVRAHWFVSSTSHGWVQFTDDRGLSVFSIRAEHVITVECVTGTPGATE